MRVLVAGAGGAVGLQLVPLLRQAGHEVGALVKSEGKEDLLRAMEAVPFVADALDPTAIQAVVDAFQPDAIINQLTAIPQKIDLAHFDRDFALTNRLRTEGTDNLIAAAKKVNVRKFVSQAFAGSTYDRSGSAIKTETDPLDANPPQQQRTTLAALRHLEASVVDSFPEGGVVLRYGWFYGPRTALAWNGSTTQAVRKRAVPIVAGGTGLWSFLHIEDAASAAVAALEGEAGIYNIADDEPARVQDWVTTLADMVGAKSPFSVPAWIARMVVGEHGVALMKDNRGISNLKAKRLLKWSPRYPRWQEGFACEFASGCSRSPL